MLRALRHATLRVAAAAVLVAVAPARSDNTPPPATSSSCTEQTATRQAPPAPSEGIATVTIRLTIDGHPVNAALNDNAAARDLATLLPVT